MNDQKHKWAEIERLLRCVLGRLAAKLTAGELTIVSEFLDHNELGLAYETIMDFVGANGIELDAISQAKLKSAAVLMGDDPTSELTARLP
jgi:hypothetical protein